MCFFFFSSKFLCVLRCKKAKKKKSLCSFCCPRQKTKTTRVAAPCVLIRFSPPCPRYPKTDIYPVFFFNLCPTFFFFLKCFKFKVNKLTNSVFLVPEVEFSYSSVLNKTQYSLYQVHSLMSIIWLLYFFNPLPSSCPQFISHD